MDVCMCVYIHIYISMHIHICMHIYTYIYINGRMHVYIYIYICINIHTSIFSWMYVFICIHTYVCIHTKMHTYIHTTLWLSKTTLTHTHTCIHALGDRIQPSIFPSKHIVCTFVLQILTNTHTHKLKYTHTQTHIHTHTNTHTKMRTHIHTLHTHIHTLIHRIHFERKKRRFSIKPYKHTISKVCVWHSFTEHQYTIGWLRLVGSLKLQVSFADYRLFYRAPLQKRPIILRSLLLVATPYPLIDWLCFYYFIRS